MKRTLFSLIGLAMLGQFANATVWRVNNQGYSAHFTGPTALQDALTSDSVSIGDTLHLEASPIDYGFLDLTKRLVVIGPGYFLNENTTPQLQHNTNAAMVSRIVFYPASAGSKVSGISQLNFNNPGTGQHQTFIAADNITVDRCRLRTAYLQGGERHNIVLTRNYFDEGVTGDNLLVTGLVIRNNRCAWILLPSTYEGEVAHNVIYSNFQGVAVNINTSVQFFNNIVRSSTFAQNNNTVANVHHNILNDSPAWLVGSTNHLGMAPAQVFSTATPTTDGSLITLPPGSCAVCHTGGVDNGGIGMFFGPQPYMLSGIPSIPAIYQLWSTGSAIQGGNLQVTIGTRSNN